MEGQNEKRKLKENDKPVNKKTKKTKRERKQSDPLLLLNIDHLLEIAKSKVFEARIPTNSNNVYNWPLIRQAQSFIKDLRALALKAVYRLPRELKRQFCKSCNVYLLPGVTSRCHIRVADGYKFLSIDCLLCKKIKKLIIKRGIKQKKNQKHKKKLITRSPNQNRQDSL